MYRPVDAAAQGFEIGAPGGRIRNSASGICLRPSARRCSQPRRSALNAPATSPAVHEVRHVLHGFPSRGRLRIRDAGGYAAVRRASPRAAWWRRFIEARNWVACASSQGGGADAAGLLDAPIWV
ncbi:MAG: hypothetical protein ACLR7Z_03170 [Bilophila wadsworthia]